MQSIEENSFNQTQPLFEEDNLKSIYYSTFNHPLDDGDNIIPYRDTLIDIKTEYIDDAYIEAMNTYISAEVVVTGKTDIMPSLYKIKKLKRDRSGALVGVSNPNPILDTRIYELEIPDSRIKEYDINITVDNMIEHVANDGWDTGLMKYIDGLRRGDEIAVLSGPSSYTLPNGIKRPDITTKRWYILET